MFDPSYITAKWRICNWRATKWRKLCFLQYGYIGCSKALATRQVSRVFLVFRFFEFFFAFSVRIFGFSFYRVDSCSDVNKNTQCFFTRKKTLLLKVKRGYVVRQRSEITGSKSEFMAGEKGGGNGRDLPLRAPLIPFPGGDPVGTKILRKWSLLLLLNRFSAIAIVA